MNSVFIVIFIFLAVFGSVYMLKPSIRDQRLAKLRLEAIKLGLQVKLDKFKVDSKKTGVRDDITAAQYQRFKPEVKSHALRWCVVRQMGWDQEGLADGWSWHNCNAKPNLELLNALLSELTDDVLLIEVYDNRARLLTVENKSSDAEQLNTWIESAQQL